MINNDNMSSTLLQFPSAQPIVESHYNALFSYEFRDEQFYIRTDDGKLIFENPVHSKTMNRKVKEDKIFDGLQMRAKDFLASISAFADFSDEELTLLEQKSSIVRYQPGDIIFKQGESGDVFFVINQGVVEVLIQDNPALLKRGDFGRVVNRLTEGLYFGERALMTSELRAATIRVVQEAVCLAFSRTVYEEIISGNNALLGKDAIETVDWSKDHETRSLFKHIESVLDIAKIDASITVKRILYKLSTAFTPELSADEVISRMVMTVKMALKVDRVGLFVLSEDRRTMVLKVSERSKGIKLPVRGLAGAVLQTNTAINIPDAYQDPRFDATMDRRTGYRTRQILGVPVRHPLTGEAIGLLQVNNRLDGSITEGFTSEQQKILELAAEQLSELLHGRADVFIHTGGMGVQKSYGQGVGDGLVLLNSAEVNTTFQIGLEQLSLGNLFLQETPNSSSSGNGSSFISGSYGFNNYPNYVVSHFTSLEILVSLHLSLVQLCAPRKIRVDIPSNVYALMTMNNGSPIAVRSGSFGGSSGSNTSLYQSYLFGGQPHPSQLLSLAINERLEFDISVRDLPRATRVLFRIYGSRKKKSSSKSMQLSPAGVGGNSAVHITSSLVPLGWTAAAIFDFKSCVDSMLTDLRFFKCNPGGVDSYSSVDSSPGSSASASGGLITTTRMVDVPINTTLNNSKDARAAVLSVVLAPDLVLTHDSSTPRVRIVHSMPIRSEHIIEGTAGTSTSPVNRNSGSGSGNNSLSGVTDREGELSESQVRELDRIITLSFNPLSTTLLNETDKEFLWDLRYNILTRSQLLPAFVMSIQWHDSERVQELYDLLDLWEPPSPEQALQLLDRRFMDPKVRAYAAHCLEVLPDEKLALYMLQLCQQLKFENHVDSALSRFLLRRALRSQRDIGHIYFWLLQSEVHNLDVTERFVILLQIYIRNCGSHRVELGHQMFVMRRLEKVAQAVVTKGDSKESRKAILREKLNEVKATLPAVFKLPLNPHFKVCGIDVNACRVMESKKKPLWLTLKDAGGMKDIVLMLKVGDDLRQDALIMQLLRVMYDLWRAEGLDMQMMLYDCISTGHERGLLQVVPNATTLGNIIIEATDKNNKSSKSGTLTRKISSAYRAVSDFSVLHGWIRAQVEADISDESLREREMEKRVQNFMISTAAYCVASYVLGLGDRHNDNLMMTRSGHFFHIDFGHILGNFKSKLGVKRERAPFVFTPAMKAVMRPEQYEMFVDLCCDVYNILREHSMLLVSLFSLAIPCNLPELQEEKDVMWIYEKLMVGSTDEEASEHFKKQLEISLNTLGTRINDAAHMLAHA